MEDVDPKVGHKPTSEGDKGQGLELEPEGRDGSLPLVLLKGPLEKSNQGQGVKINV